MEDIHSTFVVYGRGACPFCIRAKRLLDMKDEDYTYVSLEEDEESMNWFLDQGFKTVPIIYHDDYLVGGFEELKELLDT